MYNDRVLYEGISIVARHSIASRHRVVETENNVVNSRERMRWILSGTA